MIDSTISLDEFEDLLSEDGLPDEALTVMRQIFSDIRPVKQRFKANSDELINLAVKHSPTYTALPEERRKFLNGVMKLPIFFVIDPD
ncbi:hypothetical protein BSQ98_10450 [Serratia liquefaciens]|jgi:hypothetical protein|uniref:hypothetical protein n=1 Tax=Serratia liquefaciens TaxID=614 RepID=UPI001021EA18|nr:hypothetical protein [Serratia liquefaciens]RYM64466.1 hypothetical protein BSQ98_10450 [Serratia liquefaciens]